MEDSTIRKSESENGKGVKLTRSLSIWGGISMVVGTMIGSGIFISPVGIISSSGSVGSSLVIWVISGFISTICSLCYIELGLMIDASGAEYSYCYRAFGGLVGFLCGWTFIVIARPAILAIIMTTFAEYTAAPFYPGCQPPELVKKCLAITAILIITALNCLNAKLAGKIMIFFTVAKLVLVFSIIVGGVVLLANGETQNLENGFEGTALSASAWAIAIYNGMFSYDGWNSLNFVSEELQNPVRNFPIVICVGIPLVTLCYLMVNVAYFAAMSPNEMMASSAVAITFGARAFGSMMWIVPVGVACSTFGAANGLLFTSARIPFAAGQNGHLPRVLSYLSVTRLTPVMSVMLISFVGIIMVMPETSSIGQLLDIFSFAMWTVYALTFLAIIVFRFKEPFRSMDRPFKVWLPVPFICMAISLFIVIAPLIENPSISYLLTVIIIFSGLLFYIPFIWLKLTLPFGIYEKVVIFCQKYLELVPVGTGERTPSITPSMTSKED